MVEGAAEETQTLLGERFDLIFFTGGSRVGQIVLEKAAKYLTPVVLELGGKSPCLVDRDASLEVAARRIAWGRFSNAGQTCVAPDYVLVHEAVELELLAHLRSWPCSTFYGDDPRKSPDYCRIVNDRNFERLAKLLRDGEVVCGGTAEAKERYIAPTILCAAFPPSSWSCKMRPSGRFCRSSPSPAWTPRSRSSTTVPSRLLSTCSRTTRQCSGRSLTRQARARPASTTSSKGMGVPELPFGGVGDSGMGRYHGQWSFETFTHRKGVLAKSTHLDIPVRYPPYTDGHLALMKLID